VQHFDIAMKFKKNAEKVQSVAAFSDSFADVCAQTVEMTLRQKGKTIAALGRDQARTDA